MAGGGVALIGITQAAPEAINAQGMAMMQTFMSESDRAALPAKGS